MRTLEMLSSRIADTSAGTKNIPYARRLLSRRETRHEDMMGHCLDETSRMYYYTNDGNYEGHKGTDGVLRH